MHKKVNCNPYQSAAHRIVFNYSTKNYTYIINRMLPGDNPDDPPTFVGQAYFDVS